MSNLLRKRRPTASGTQIGPSSSKKQRFIDATKMLLDIVKESADACPPLKSCLGCIGALIKHYEESKDVEDKLEALIPWLTKLEASMTTARTDDNHEEAERREQLARSLEDIKTRSLVLSGKGKATRILDKRQDSGMVVKLIEELRQAILIYQLSQQRSIGNQVAQLTSSFNAFLKIREEQQGVKGKVVSILRRLARFNVEGITVGGRDESKRRVLLFEALEEIKEELLQVSERSSAVGYEENEADVTAVCDLAEDFGDAIMHYQLAQQKAIYEQNCGLIDVGDQTVLNSYRRARGAGYQHGDRNGCLKGTRKGVLDEIERWTQDSDSKNLPVFWLNGLAGTGKTTIAQTVAERVFAEGLLGASFFCSRDFEDRSDLRFIFPTLAFQLAYKYPEFRSHFVSLLRKNPDIVYESLYNQMEKLIVEPLQAAGVSTIIVIDALDECKDHEPASAILSVLGRFVGLITNAKFFITGRPEKRIETGFRLPLLIDSTDVFVLHDVHPCLVNNDIRLFLKHELSGLAQRRQLEKWPTEEHIDVLCHRAAGLFVYAVATVKFLDSNTHLPRNRLDSILKVPECTAPEGKTRFNPKTTLDSLYTSILQAAFNEEDPDVDSKARAIIGTIVMVVNPLSPAAIAELINVETEEVILFLTLVQSLFIIGKNPEQPVKPFHKSFPDFITDPSRCADARFFISPGHLHLQLATDCLRVMNSGLEQDLLSLPECALNSEIIDLQTRINNQISVALQYACRSWHSHLIETEGDITGVISCLRTLLQVKFLAWLEVLSVLGAVGGAVVALEKLMPWTQEIAEGSEFATTARDYFYFVTKFFEPINASAAHIYQSALELCPTSSIVRRFYYHRSGRIARLPRVVVGSPGTWDPTISISAKEDYKFCTWSPSGRLVAVMTGNTVEIRNHLTFELLAILKPAATTPLLSGPLAYSPDERSLACGSHTTIVIWDIQTGGVAKEFVIGAKTVSLVWSLDGRMIGTLECLHQNITPTETRVNTYDVASGASLFIETIRSNHRLDLLAHEESFRVLITKGYPFGRYRIQIQIEALEIRSLPTATHTFANMAWDLANNTGTDYTPDMVSFSPTTSRVSVSTGDELFIFPESQSLVPLLREKGRFLFPCFSSDGKYFAASKEYDIHIWEYVDGRYALWKKFRCPGQIDFLQFSPNSSSLLSHSKNILQISRLEYLPTQPVLRPRQFAAISRSGRLIASAVRLEETVTIVEPHSQSPSQLIATGVQIEKFLLAGNVLLVAGSNQVLAWRLTDEGLVDGVLDRGMPDWRNSIWTIPFSLSSHKLEFKVQGDLGVIERNGKILLYHTTTGEGPWAAQTPPRFSRPGFDIGERLRGRYRADCHNMSQPNTPPESGWYPSGTMAREGWIKDAEGRHSLWLYVEWRKSWELEDWCHDIATQFSNVEGQPVIVKF